MFYFKIIFKGRKFNRIKMQNIVPLSVDNTWSVGSWGLVCFESVQGPFQLHKDQVKFRCLRLEPEKHIKFILLAILSVDYVNGWCRLYSPYKFYAKSKANMHYQYLHNKDGTR